MGLPDEQYFTVQLIQWHTYSNQRSLPWKSEKDPYKIWLSEIILQQTRAQQALPYYMAFTEAYPAIGDMAIARDEDVFRLWQGLGYYNRCKNMLATARFITERYDGIFPSGYDDIVQLKGVGAYTASAIASFAFGLPYAVVDGNVYRVLARYFGVDTPYDTTAGKKLFATLAQRLLETEDSAAYNQAIMDLGATVCTPRLPLCGACPLQKRCVAFHSSLTDVLPVKLKKQAVRERFFHYLLLRFNDELWIRKRTGKDIWTNLHEPMMIETGHPMDTNQLLAHELFNAEKLEYNEIIYEGASKQRLTHQIINARFFTLKLIKKPFINDINSEWMDSNKLKKAAFPKTLVSFLKNNLYF